MRWDPPLDSTGQRQPFVPEAPAHFWPYRRPSRVSGGKPDVTSETWRHHGFQGVPYPGPGQESWDAWIVR